MAEISQIKLPSGTAYMLKDVGALQLTGGTVTGPTTFSDTISVDDATIGTMIVNGAASFTNTIQANNFKTVEFNSSTDQYKSINCDVTKAEIEAQGTLTSSSSNSDWLQALVKAICVKYPNKTNYLFKGYLAPNSSGYYEVLIYDTATVDSNGLPQYSFGTFRKYTDVYEKFWTSSYTWGHGTINTNTDTKVTITAVTPASETTNYLLTYTATSGTVGVNANAKARMWEKEGTTSSGGYISLALGNNVATGTDGNSTGNIYLYGTTAYFNKIAPGGPTSNLTQTLPTNGSGTLINTVGGQTIDSTLQIKNILTLYREGTTANDYATGILFKNKDTTTGYTSEGCYIYAYQDHGPTATYGCNLVIRPGRNLFIGSGEAPSNHYALYKNSTTENIYLTADNYLYAQAGGGTIANRKGFRLDNSGNIIPCQADTDTNNVGSIGLSQYKWANLYVTNINGVAVGNSPNFNNTTYSAGTGLSLSSTTFSLATSGATAGSYGPSADASPAHSGTFKVPYVTVDAYGRVTAASTKTITLPASGNTDTKVTQGTTTTTSWRKLLTHYTATTQGADVPADVTNVVYSCKKLEVQPSTGILSAGGYIGPGSVEYIKGTQTGSTNAWTGTTKEAAIYDGKMIMYVLPYAGTSTGATLNLTLSGGGTTGAKSIYRYAATTAVTTHFAAGSRILMIYDSTNTRWNTVAYYNSNTTYSAGNGLKLSSTTFSVQYAVGDVIVTSTNTNPSGTYGGTWTLIDKDYAYKWIDSPITFNTTNTQNGTSSAFLHGHTIRIYASWENKVALSDTTTAIGTINYSTIGGQTNSFYGKTITVPSDGANAVGLIAFSVDDTNQKLNINSTDWISKSLPTTTGHAIVLDTNYITRSYAVMLDSFCDKFYWKRTA